MYASEKLEYATIRYLVYVVGSSTEISRVIILKSSHTSASQYFRDAQLKMMPKQPGSPP